MLKRCLLPLFLACFIAVQAFGFAGARTPPVGPSAPVPVPAPVARGGSATQLFVEATNENFSPTPPDGVGITPSCLRKGGVELLILDPGHDDSPGSMRSDAKVRGGGSATQFIWPKIHEGNLTQVTAWLVYDLILRDRRLSDRERQELQTMIRFTRHPGEKTYGQYEKELGYSSSTQGTIDGGVTNRAARIRFMMENQHTYDPNSDRFWAGPVQDVTSKSVMISVHANSSDYFDEGDVSWVIPPKNTASGSPTAALQHGLVLGLSHSFGAYYQPLPTDPRAIADLKNEVAPTVQASSILTQAHTVNLAVLSPALGNSGTRKLLLEGFVMNGKAGDLANRDLNDTSNAARLSFKHHGSTTQGYGVSEVYVAYAKGIVTGINTALGCTR